MIIRTLKIYWQSILSLSSILKQRKIEDHHWKGIFCVFLTVLFVVACLTFSHYGVPCDDVTQKGYGNRILLWYYTFFRNKEALSWRDLYFYGGFFEVVAQVFANTVAIATASNLFETRHFINMLFAKRYFLYGSRKMTYEVMQHCVEQGYSFTINDCSASKFGAK